MDDENLKLIFDLIEDYAEARHKQGHSTYNVKTNEALNKVKEAITAALTPAPTEKTLRQATLDLYIPPFRYVGGYIYDSNNNTVADSGTDTAQGTIISRIRGWGRIAYLDNPKARAEQLQDEAGRIVAEALNMYWKTPAKQGDNYGHESR